MTKHDVCLSMSKELLFIYHVFEKSLCSHFLTFNCFDGKFMIHVGKSCMFMKASDESKRKKCAFCLLLLGRLHRHCLGNERLISFNREVKLSMYLSPCES